MTQTAHTFSSIHHPGEMSLALVVARAQAQPVALALIAVMVATLPAVLQGEPVLGTVVWVAPLAYGVAAAWSLYELRRKPAELIVRGGFGTMRSVWDVARSRDSFDAERIRLHPLFEPGKKDGLMHIGLGDTVFTLRPAEWPRYTELLATLRQAAAALQSLSST